MRLLIGLLLIIFAYSKEVEITKYLSSDKPSIVVEYQNLNKKLLGMINSDFKVISHFNYKLKKYSFNGRPNFADYNSSYLFRVYYKKNSLKVIGYNILNRKMVLNKVYKIPSFKYYPFMIHKFSYEVNNIVGGESVEWINRKIVYSVYTAPKESAIFIADYSLKYRKRVVKGGLNIFPKWADKKQTTIYYTSLKREPTLYRYNIYTGKRDKLLSSNGMLVVSDVKGSDLLLTMAIDDQPDIYLFNVKTKKIKELTDFGGIDVNGQFYRGNSIAFISDRFGKPFVFSKNLENGNVDKILYFGKNQIALSIFKDKAVISSRESSNRFKKNTFNLFLLKKDSNVIKRLTFNGKNMFPKFSVDGNTIIFIKEFHFSSKIGIIRLKENLVFYYPISKKLQSLDW